MLSISPTEISSAGSTTDHASRIAREASKHITTYTRCSQMSFIPLICSSTSDIINILTTHIFYIDRRFSPETLHPPCISKHVATYPLVHPETSLPNIGSFTSVIVDILATSLANSTLTGDHTSRLGIPRRKREALKHTTTYTCVHHRDIIFLIMICSSTSDISNLISNHRH